MIVSHVRCDKLFHVDDTHVCTTQHRGIKIFAELFFERYIKKCIKYHV